MDQSITDGVEPAMGAVTAGAGLIARLILFPLATLRRRAMTDAPDADPTGVPYVPRPIQKSLILVVMACGGAVVALLTGEPPVHGASSALSGAAIAMALFDVQHKRG